MALPKLTINLGAGGLGRPLEGKDHVSGLISFQADATLPAGFGTDKIKQIFSLKDAEDLGIIKGSADFGVLWYHISEFFNGNARGILWVGLYDGAVGTIPNFSAHTFPELAEIQATANGEIRQLGISLTNTPMVTAILDLIDTEAKKLRADGVPLSVIYGGDISATTDLSTLPDLKTLDNELVSVVIGQDGSGVGSELATSTSKSVVGLGTVLGIVSSAKVSESIAWVERFDVQHGAELDEIAFGNGDLTKLKSKSFLDALATKGYVFFRKFTAINLSGTYITDSLTAVSSTSDYATIENNRTIDKASRLINTFVTPKLNSPLTVNPDGNLSEPTIATFKDLTDSALQQMLVDGEISAFESIIDPTQDVLSTSKIIITVKIVPVGVAREIEYTVGYILSI